MECKRFSFSHRLLLLPSPTPNNALLFSRLYNLGTPSPKAFARYYLRTMSHTGDRFTDFEPGNKRLPACYGYIMWDVLPLEEAMRDLHSLFPQIDRLIKEAKKHCTYPNDHGLSKDQAGALHLYTTEMPENACLYRTLNQTLRLEDRSQVRPWFAYLKLLDSAVSKLPNFKGIVWRGVDRDVSMAYQKGQKITWWSVSSCSVSVDIIKTFLGQAPQNTLFTIECSTGKSITPFACYQTEQEVILMPGTTLRVVSDPLRHHGGLHVVHLKEITDDDDDVDGDAGAETQEVVEQPTSLGKYMNFNGSLSKT